MRNIILAALVAACTAMTGCANLGNGKIDPSPTTQALVKATIQYAVLRAVGGDPSRAIRIAEIASQAIQFAQADDVTTANALEGVVREYIGYADLTPENQLLADTLISVIRAEIEARIGDKTLDGKTLVQVVAVLTWVRDTAGRVQAEK